MKPSPSMKTAVVLDMGANGLGVARSLAHNGIPVLGLDFEPRAPGFRSRYVEGTLCPDPVTSPGDLLDHLLEVGAQLPTRGVLIPCTDAFVQFLSRNRRALGERFQFVLPEEQVIEGLVYKRFQYEWAARLGVPMTQTFFPKDMTDVRDIRDVLRYPAFIKGHSSHLWNRVFGNKGFIVNDATELEDRFARVFEAGLEALVQKIIMPPGENFVAMGAYIGNDGYATPAFTWQKVRQSPPNFGIGSLLLSKRYPDVGEMGLKFMKGIGFKGMGVIGFKRDPDDGLWKLIEMNGRSWFQIYMATRCGMNLPLVYYLDAQGLELPHLQGFKEGVRWWNSLDDFDSFVRLRREGRIATTEWIRSWFVPDLLPYYEMGDIGPALRQANYGVAWAKKLGGLLKMREDEDARWR